MCFCGRHLELDRVIDFLNCTIACTREKLESDVSSVDWLLCGTHRYKYSVQSFAGVRLNTSLAVEQVLGLEGTEPRKYRPRVWVIHDHRDSGLVIVELPRDCSILVSSSLHNEHLDMNRIQL